MMKLEDFPELLHDQVALIRAEKATGIVLDDQFKRHISKEQVFYSVFENREMAMKYIDQCKRTDVEFTIFGKRHELLYQHTRTYT
jgi:hypothetical protein